MKKPLSLMEEPKAIKRVWLDEDDSSHYTVGQSGVTEIVPYWENGQQWLCVYDEKGVLARLNVKLLKGIDYE